MPGPASALRFATAAIERGHHILQIFFQGDGAYMGNLLSTPPQGEPNIYERWHIFAETHKTPLLICSTAAQRRGIFDAQMSHQLVQNNPNLSPAFTIAGQMQLLESCQQADCVISF